MFYTCTGNFGSPQLQDLCPYHLLLLQQFVVKHLPGGNEIHFVIPCLSRWNSDYIHVLLDELMCYGYL